MEFLEIDGGRGGGQMVRSAITLSCITNRPICVYNIRKNRKVPGLRPQHVTAIKILQKISDADVSGGRVGSTKLKFHPRGITYQDLFEDVQTAGSITLILQAIIPLAVILEKAIKIRIRGGTDVRWSPTTSYMQKIYKHALQKMGIGFSIEIIRRGYFPKGRGEIKLQVFPSKINPVIFSKKTTGRVKIACSYSKIPLGVIKQRITDMKEGLDVVHVELKQEDAVDPGASFLAYSIDDNTIFGVDSLSEKAFETQGFSENLFGIDENLADMLVVPASLASGKTVFCVKEITCHLETNLFVTSKMTGCRYGVGRLPDGYQVIIEGASHPGIKQGCK